MTTFVLAVRREMRDVAPGDWQARVGAIPGIRVQGDAAASPLQVEADLERLDRLRAAFGGLLHIEPLARRERLD